MRRAILAAVAFLAAGAVSADKNDDNIWFARGEVKKRLKDPDSARFSQEYVSRSGGAPVVCGHVAAKNGFGGYNSPEPYIFIHTIGVLMRVDFEPGEFEKTWNQVCAG